MQAGGAGVGRLVFEGPLVVYATSSEYRAGATTAMQMVEGVVEWEGEAASRSKSNRLAVLKKGGQSLLSSACRADSPLAQERPRAFLEESWGSLELGLVFTAFRGTACDSGAGSRARWRKAAYTPIP